MLLVGYCIISALLQSVTDYHGVSGGYRSIMEVGHTGELQSVISDSACIATDSMQAGYLLPPHYWISPECEQTQSTLIQTFKQTHRHTHL